ncbi:hypothetical protein AVEN_720-1 [Araneus ventricosus]|uniref:RNase H type-1 domain-containing protein n=1 Tax=Araneus ventricosus TaxID=182803 RepID=A0A4Y2BW46_ARAVE|nr:hypothetical protein AVEN_720-1 [Araneus ventricosus]
MEFKRYIFLLDHPKINGTWAKARVGNFGNEKPDQLAKAATRNGQSRTTNIELPKSLIKNLLRKGILEKWQIYWNEGGTGRNAFNTITKVSLCPMIWVREEIIFFTEYGPFLAYLRRFGLARNDFCTCGGI